MTSIEDFPYDPAYPEYGVPLLGMKGDRLVAHMGESILDALGMTDWIAASADDYVAKAAAFAGDLALLAALRANLRARLLIAHL